MVAETQPPFDPRLLKKLCNDAGASKLFNAILYAMFNNDQVAGTMHLNKKRAVNIIYMLVFGQSQKANWFQKTLSRQVVTKGISESGLKLELASQSLLRRVILHRCPKIMTY